MIIILDTNFLFALKSRKDQYHQRAYELLNEIQKENSKYFTNNFILNETFTLAIYRSRGNLSFLEQYINLFFGKDNFFQVIQSTQDEFVNIIEICKKYVTPKRLLSFADASLIYLYQKINADYLLSFDNHFDNILTRKF
ncbi:MAG: type II toxin-antitoxin system VapC family toxin [Candidatus Lokiarchaeota archaeon]|nr:type II toxin-antitoxin system VapC family toxin [Candidatus Lokiarchaeota archaeon]